MAQTPSTMIALGTKATDFNLFDTVAGEFRTLHELKSDIATVIMFICNHCPYVKYIQKKLLEVATHYSAKGIKFIAISANDSINYPEDSPEKMKQEAQLHHYPFPYLYDESQEVAKKYQAACTPDFYIFDQDVKCVYRGRFDDSTPGNGLASTGRDICEALDNILAHRPINPQQIPSIGCNIKWKKLFT